MMTLIALAVEMIVNVFLVIRNAVIRLLPAPEFVVVTVRGPLPERRPVSPARLRRWLGRMWDTPPPESLEEWRERLRLLAGDPRVRGIVLKLGDLQAGLASLEGLRSEEHTSELQSRFDLVCRLLLEKKKNNTK